MRWHRLAAPTCALLCAALLAGPAPAQPTPPSSALPNPELLTVSPPGGQAGTTVEVTFTGTHLEEPEALLFSHAGIKAEPVVTPAPAPAAAPKKGANTKKPAMAAAKPAVAKFKITISPDTPPGIHDVRLVNSWGISNPRAFVVGDLPEVQEKEPNNDVTQAQKVPLNCTVNGTIANPTDVDFYLFPGTKGQRVVVSCRALSIDSRLQPELEVYDAHGRLLGGNYRYQGNRHFANSDSLVDCSLPENGDYYIRVAQFTYTQGDPQHFYRLTISTAPWIDAVFPVAVEPGKPAKVTVYGRNLPGGQPDPAAVIDGRPLEKLAVTVNVPPLPEDRKLTYSGYLGPAASALDGIEYRLRNATGVSNPYFLTYAKAPVVADNGANDTTETAQEVPLPCEIAGHVEKLHDRDWYAFTAKKGDIYNIEVISDRLEAPTDMYFILQNAATKQNIIEADDNPDTFSPKFFARTDDPAVYRFTVPADGKYLLLVASRLADTTADPRHNYLVRITPDQPDFRLAIMPADFHRPDACCVRQGGSESFSVFAWRQDGFREDIELSVEGLPKGVTCAPQVVGGPQRQTSLVLSAAADAPAWTGTITVKGTATVHGKKVVREARPASIVWGVQPQSNIPTVTRLDRNLVLAVRDKAPFRLEASIDKPAIVQGSKAQITLKLTRLWPEFKTPLQVFLMDPVQNLIINNNQPANLAPGKDSITIPVTVNANLIPGTYNVVFRGQAQIPFNKDPKQKQRPNTPVVLPSSAVTLTVLPKALANVSLQPQAVTVKAGKQAEMTVRVNRLFNYDGEFKVEVVVPPAAKGITADPAVIPAGKNEAKVIIKAAADAKPGNRGDLLVRAVALFNGKAPTKHEVKFNVNVVK